MQPAPGRPALQNSETRLTTQAWAINTPSQWGHRLWRGVFWVLSGRTGCYVWFWSRVTWNMMQSYPQQASAPSRFLSTYPAMNTSWDNICESFWQKKKKNCTRHIASPINPHLKFLYYSVFLRILKCKKIYTNSQITNTRLFSVLPMPQRQKGQNSSFILPFDSTTSSWISRRGMKSPLKVVNCAKLWSCGGPHLPWRQFRTQDTGSQNPDRTWEESFLLLDLNFQSLCPPS